jgi:hypothetical protein
LQRNIFVLCFLIVAVCIPAAGFAMGLNAEAQPPPAVQGEVQQLPAEEYIPEGDPTPPPPLAVRDPQLVVVPSGEAQVYMVPNMVGVYFYGGSWYRFHHGVWFRAGIYSDPWVLVAPAIVPSFVIGISPAYALYLPPTYHRIHYRDFHSHWRTWDRERHWHRYDWYRHEQRIDVRRERERHSHARMEKERHVRNERIKERERHPQRIEHKGPQRTGEVKGQKPGPVGQQRTGQVRQQKSAPVGQQKTGQVVQQKPAPVGQQRTGQVSKQPRQQQPPKQRQQKQQQKDDKQYPK